MNLTSNESLVLYVLSDKSRKFGLQIFKEIEETGEKLSSVGTMYNIIERLEKKGLVKLTKEDTEEKIKAKRGGKNRHYVKITAKGITSFEQYKEQVLGHYNRIIGLGNG